MHGGVSTPDGVLPPPFDSDFSSPFEPDALFEACALDSWVGFGFGVLTLRVVFEEVLFLYFGSFLTSSMYSLPAFSRCASISSWLTPVEAGASCCCEVLAASVVTSPVCGGPMTTLEPTTAAVAAAGTAIAATTGRCLTVASTDVAVEGASAECRPVERLAAGARSRISCLAKPGFGEECLPNAEIP